MIKTNKSAKILVALLLAIATVFAVLALNPIKDAKAYSTVHTVYIDLNGCYNENATAFNMADAVLQLKNMFAEETADASQCQAEIVVLADEGNLYNYGDGSLYAQGSEWVTGLSVNDSVITNKAGEKIASVVVRGAEAANDSQYNILSDKMAYVKCADYHGMDIGALANNYEFRNINFTSNTLSAIDIHGVNITFGKNVEFYTGESQFTITEGTFTDKTIILEVDVRKVYINTAKADGVKYFATTQDALNAVKTYYANSDYDGDKCRAEIYLETNCNTSAGGNTEQGMFSDPCITVTNKKGELIGKILIQGKKDGLVVTGNIGKSVTDKYISNNYELVNFTYKLAQGNNASFFIGKAGYSGVVPTEVIMGENFKMYSAGDTLASLFMGRASDGANGYKSRKVHLVITDAELSSVALVNSAYVTTVQTIGTASDPWVSVLDVNGNTKIERIQGVGCNTTCTNLTAKVTLRDNASVKYVNFMNAQGGDGSANEYVENVDFYLGVKDNASITDTGNNSLIKRYSYKSMDVSGSATIEVDTSALANIKAKLNWARNEADSSNTAKKNAMKIHTDFNLIVNGTDEIERNAKTAFVNLFNFRCINFDGNINYTLNGGVYSNANPFYDSFVKMYDSQADSVMGEFSITCTYTDVTFTATNVYFGCHIANKFPNGYKKLTNNFYGNNKFGQNVMLSNTSAAGEEKGDVENNIYGPFSILGTNAMNIRSTSYSQKQTGNVVMNFLVPEGGEPYEFIGAYCAVATGSISGNVTNNFGKGVTFTRSVVGGTNGTGSISGKITNNIDGAIFNDSFTGSGTCGGIENNIKNATFKGTFNGLTSGKNCNGDIVNNFGENTTFAKAVKCGSQGSSVVSGTVTNNFNGADFSDSVIGSKNCDALINNFNGGTFAKTVNAADASATIKQSVTNNFNGGTFQTGTYFGGAGALTCPLLTNNIYDAVFEKYIGFGVNGNSGSIGEQINNFYGGTYKSYCIGGCYSLGAPGNITNNIVGDVSFLAYFGATVSDGTNLTTVKGNVTNNVKADPNDPSKVPVFGQGFRGLGQLASCTGTVTNNIEAGIFKAEFWAANQLTNGTTTATVSIGGIVNNISNITFTKNAYLGEFSTSTGYINIENGVTNNIKDCTFNTALYAASYSTKTPITIKGNVNNTFENCTFDAEFSCGAYSKVSIDGKITNYIKNCEATGTGDANRITFAGADTAIPSTNAVKGGVETTVDGFKAKSSIYFSSYNNPIGVQGEDKVVVKATINNLFVPAQISITNRGSIYGKSEIILNSGAQLSKENYDNGTRQANASVILGSYGGKAVGDVTYTINGGAWGNINSGIGGGLAAGDFVLSSKNTLNLNGGAVRMIGTNNNPIPLTVNIDLANDDVMITGSSSANANVTVNVIPSEKHSIVFGKQTRLYVKNILDKDGKVDKTGVIRVDQAEDWYGGHYYLYIPKADYSFKNIKCVESDASGRVMVEVDSSNIVVRGENTPVYGNSLNIGADVGVRYYVLKADVDKNIENAGEWTYKLQSGSKNVTASFKSVEAAENALEIKELGGIKYYVLEISGFAPTEYFNSIEFSSTNREVNDKISVNDLLKIVINDQNGAYSDSFKAMCKAMFNYGIEACKRFDVSGAPSLDPYTGVEYSNTYVSNASKSSEVGTKIEFFGTGVTLDGAVTMNFYAKADAGFDYDLLTIRLNGADYQAKVTKVDELDYNTIISIPVAIRDLAKTLKVEALYSGELQATITDSVSYYCIDAINMAAHPEDKDICKALLTFVEKSNTYFASIEKDS